VTTEEGIEFGESPCEYYINYSDRLHTIWEILTRITPVTARKAYTIKSIIYNILEKTANSRFDVHDDRPK